MQAMRGEAPPFNPPGARIATDVWAGLNVRANFDRIKIRGPVFIGGSASIGDGCEITGPVFIGANACIEAGARIEASIILEHTRVSGFASYQRKVVGPDFCFDPEGTVLDSRNTDIGWLFSDARSPEASLNEDQRLIMAHNLGAAMAHSLDAATGTFAE